MINPPFAFNDIPLLIKNEYIPKENSYTILVGNNGVGKSRLLNALSRSYILTAHYDPTNNLQRAIDFQTSFNEPKVIAVSTSPFDDFKLPRRNVEKKDHTTNNYRYVGMRSNGLLNSGSISLISSVAHGLLDKLLNDKGFNRLSKVFQVLGFDPSLEFIFKPMFRNDLSKKNITRSEYEDPEILRIEEMLGVTLDSRLHPIVKELNEEALGEIFSALNCYYEAYDEDDSQSYFRLIADYEDYWNYRFTGEHFNDEYLLKAILTLLQYDLIRLMDLKLIKESNPDMSLRRASSGEQCMLVIMLGIAGHISDYSKIFIDEPEISLHPAWQEKFMTLLIEVFSSYRGCNFFIATHSPQIISKLESNNCFITSLTKKQIYSASDFRERSADFQLAEIFDAPGVMNEYLIRKAFGLLSKIKSTKKVTPIDKKELESLLGFSKKLDPQDPLLELIKTVTEMCNHYASN